MLTAGPPAPRRPARTLAAVEPRPEPPSGPAAPVHTQSLRHHQPAGAGRHPPLTGAGHKCAAQPVVPAHTRCPAARACCVAVLLCRVRGPTEHSRGAAGQRQAATCMRVFPDPAAGWGKPQPSTRPHLPCSAVHQGHRGSQLELPPAQYHPAGAPPSRQPRPPRSLQALPLLPRHAVLRRGPASNARRCEAPGWPAKLAPTLLLLLCCPDARSPSWPG